MRQNLRAIRGEDNIILDAHAPPPRSIDTRFDRYDRPLREGTLRRPCQSWRLVNFETNPVPETVPEFLAKPGPLNVLSRNGVGIPPRHSRADATRRALVGRPNNLVH